MRKLLVFTAGLALAASASAHDLWLQPNEFWQVSGQAFPMAVLIGHGPDRENWGLRADRIVLLKDFAPDRREFNLLPFVRARDGATSLPLRFSQPGTHVVAMQSNHAQSDLPAERFNEYAQTEGLTPAIAFRARTGANGKAGREIYSRRAKMIIQIGAADPKSSVAVTRPVGFDLEIVPERHPYLLKAAEKLPVRVYYRGKPLSGALVKLTNLNADARPVEEHRTDAAGRARFTIPAKGKWLLNVVWTRPITGNPKADFDTIFSSLTFGSRN